MVKVKWVEPKIFVSFFFFAFFWLVQLVYSALFGRKKKKKGSVPKKEFWKKETPRGWP